MKINPMIVSQKTLDQSCIQSMAAHYKGLTPREYKISQTPSDLKVLTSFRLAQRGNTGANENEAWQIMNEIYPKWQDKPLKNEFLHQFLVQRAELCLSFSSFSKFVLFQKAQRLEIKKLQLQSMEIALKWLGLTDTSKGDKLIPHLVFASSTESWIGFMSFWNENIAFTNQKKFKRGTLRGSLNVALTPSYFSEECWDVGITVKSDSLELKDSIEKEIPSYYREIERTLGIKVAPLSRI